MVTSDLAIAVTTGLFGLGGGLGGVLLSSRLTARDSKRRLVAEDARRWLQDRREVYAAYLGLVDAMLRQVDGVGVFLPYHGTEVLSEEDEAMISEGLSEGLLEYQMRWDDELQPALDHGQTPSVGSKRALRLPPEQGTINGRR